MDVLVAGVPRLIDDTPFARGGEGTLHAFADGSDPRAVKCYASAPDAARRRERVSWLIAHPPAGVATHPDRSTVAAAMAWPQAEVTSLDGRFIGLTIPRVRNAVRLSELTAHPRTLSTRLGARWRPWELPAPLAVRLRMMVAARIARLVAALHATGEYVVVDVKPDNVLVTAHGEVVLVDCDSLQVADGGRLRHAARARTDEYTPPEGFDGEYLRRWEEGRPVAPSWDEFSLAVMVYQLLVGIHPFAVRGREPNTGAVVDTVSAAIQAGLYAHGGRRGMLSVIPAPHDQVAALPRVVQLALHETLDAGAHDSASRVSAAAWSMVLERCATSAARWLSAAQFAAVVSVGTRRVVARRRIQLAQCLVLAHQRLRALLQQLPDRIAVVAQRLVDARWVLLTVLGTGLIGFLLTDVKRSTATSALLDDSLAKLHQVEDRCSRWTGLPVTSGALPLPANPAPRIGAVSALRPPPAANAAATTAALEPVLQRFGRRLGPGTVLTYARDGQLALRDSVVSASRSTIVVFRRDLADASRPQRFMVMRYLMAPDGLRQVVDGDTVLLLRRGSRRGDSWVGAVRPLMMVRAVREETLTTLAGAFAAVRLAISLSGDSVGTPCTVLLSAPYGMVSQVEASATGRHSLELVSVMARTVALPPARRPAR